MKIHFVLQYLRMIVYPNYHPQDPHWSLYTDHCSPCLSNYTYIVHLENAGEEEYVLNITGLSQVSEGARVMNPTQGGRSRDFVKEFIGQLSCDTLASLYKRYWPDLVLFQYDMGDVFRWGEGGKGCERN